VRDFYLDDAELHISEEAAAKGSCEISPGTILMVVRGMSLANEFRVSMVRVRAAFNQDLKAIAPREGVEPRYLVHALRWLEPYILAHTDSAAHGTKRLPTHVLEGLMVPMPRAVEEQRRIADVLDKADAIRRKRREALALTDELLRATFLEMFGDPVTNPRGWPVEAIGPHLEIVPGWSANGSPRPAERHERGVLKVSAVTGGVYRPHENKVVQGDEFTDRELIVPERGDLLFSRANTRDLVAAVCLVGDAPSNVFLPDKLWRIRPATRRVCNEYLRYLFSHPRVHDLIASTASGTSGSMLNVSQEKVRAMRLPLPPKDLQDGFARIVWDVDAMRRRNLEAAGQSEALFAALQHRAFRGEL